MGNTRILSKNIVMNLILQITVICNGLIMPRLIIVNYGSDVNGMVSSISQFLSYITLLESGIGGVIKAVLYKPLLEKDRYILSGIVNATKRFFRAIGYIFIVYLFVVAIFYDKIAGTGKNWWFSASLVIAIGITVLLEYFFGITQLTLLQADQKLWLTSGVQIITLWISIGLSVLLINLGCSIQVVKLSTALVFFFRPICYNIYIKYHYRLDKKIPPNKVALAQRWNGFGHHIAYFIHTNTDIVLLTIFTSTIEVSVYSVYLMIVTGVKSFFAAFSGAIEPYIGRVIASGDKRVLSKTFKTYEFAQYLATTVIFITTAVLIVPFVQIYTDGVTDGNYVRPLFAVLLVAAEGFYCLRAPYSNVIFAAGHFKQTQKGAFVEAGINIGTSLALIKPFGIVGVAIGTLSAMAFRTVQYAFYVDKNIINTGIGGLFRKLLATLLSCLSVYLVSTAVEIPSDNYLSWCAYGVVTLILTFFVTSIAYVIVEYKTSKDFGKLIVSVLLKRIEMR